MIKRILSILISTGIIVTTLTGCNIKSAPKAAEVSSKSIDYEDKIFDSSYVHKIEVTISEDEINDFLQNQTGKSKYHVDVIVDGNECKDVSFSAKENTSSVQFENDTEGYNYDINFGEFIDNQNYYGLHKLRLNSFGPDVTYMKQYLSYKLMRESGVSAPLTSYVVLSINGEEKGLYLAMEDDVDSFIDRNFGNESDGQLYKLENSSITSTNNIDENFDPVVISEDEKENQEHNSENDLKSSDGSDSKDDDRLYHKDAKGDVNRGKDESFESVDNGASLLYKDDNIESYSDIFNNSETNSSNEDKDRLINSIKRLNECSSDLSDCIDADEISKYFAVHNFVDNYDSYTGDTVNNYLLYEENGVMSVLPGDYNLAFGALGFDRGHDKNDIDNKSEGFRKERINSTESMVNYPIDTPLLGTSEDQRPLWKAIIKNNNYKELYHKYLDKLISDYFESGKFENEIEDDYNTLRPYVEDSSSYYTVDEFDKAYETLKKFCILRAESIRKQLKGTIPSTEEGQDSDEVHLVNADDIEIEDMGNFHDSKMRDDRFGKQTDKNENITNDKSNGQMKNSKK